MGMRRLSKGTMDTVRRHPRTGIMVVLHRRFRTRGMATTGITRDMDRLHLTIGDIVDDRPGVYYEYVGYIVSKGSGYCNIGCGIIRWEL